MKTEDDGSRIVVNKKEEEQGAGLAQKRKTNKTQAFRILCWAILFTFGKQNISESAWTGPRINIYCDSE